MFVFKLLTIVEFEWDVDLAHRPASLVASRGIIPGETGDARPIFPV